MRVFGECVLHTCVPDFCSMWEYPSPKNKHMVFVCKESRKIHRCGAKCIYSIINKSKEGNVCTLTGMMTSTQSFLHYTRPSKDPNVKNNFNDHYIKMGNTKRRRSTPSPNTSKPPPTHLILETLKSIFSGTERHRSYIMQKERFFREVSKKFKKKRGYDINFMETSCAILSLYRSFGSMLNPPIDRSNKKIVLLSNAISDYWMKIGTSLARSPKTVGVFTAVCVSKLRTGYTINNIIIFPKIDWISRYAPSDINFSGLHIGIQCRSMSIAWRKMQEKIICPQTNTPIHGTLFSIDEDI